MLFILRKSYFVNNEEFMKLFHIISCHSIDRFFFLNYWSIVDLYCCVSFWYMAQWLSYISVRAESLQLCPAFCDSMDCKLSGSSIHGFSRQEYWSELPCPLPGDFPDPRIEPGSPGQGSVYGGLKSSLLRLSKVKLLLPRRGLIGKFYRHILFTTGNSMPGTALKSCTQPPNALTSLWANTS